MLSNNFDSHHKSDIGVRYSSKVANFVSKIPQYPRISSALCLSTVLLLFGSRWMGGSASHASRMATNAHIVAASPAPNHTATVIFLHGLGDTGQGWSQAFSMIKANHIKYICPTAQTAPVSLNAGFRMPSWFDIKSLDPEGEQDVPGIEAASNQLQNLIEEEVKGGIPHNRIIVGGFSQGGAVALYSALTNSKTLAGIIGLSTWLPIHKSFPAAVKANHNTPILQCHGGSDTLVEPRYGEMTSKALGDFNQKHTYKVYASMGHSSCEEEMLDVKKFIEANLPPI